MIVVFAREMMPNLRNPAGLLFTMVQPVVFLLLFGPLLPDNPWQWFVPGVLIMMGLFSTMSAGYSIQTELSGGSLERMLVTPLNRAGMLVGRTLKEVVSLLAQAALLVAVALPLGFELHAVSALAGLAMLAVLGVGLGSLAFALAIATKRQPELFWGVHELVLFPLLLLSGVLLPIQDAPGWLQAMSQVNPMTYLVEAERSLFAGDYMRLSVLYGAGAAAAIAVVGLGVGTRAMRRATL